MPDHMITKEDLPLFDTAEWWQGHTYSKKWGGGIKVFADTADKQDGNTSFTLEFKFDSLPALKGITLTSIVKEFQQEAHFVKQKAKKQIEWRTDEPGENFTIMFNISLGYLNRKHLLDGIKNNFVKKLDLKPFEFKKIEI